MEFEVNPDMCAPDQNPEEGFAFLFSCAKLLLDMVSFSPHRLDHISSPNFFPPRSLLLSQTFPQSFLPSVLS